MSTKDSKQIEQTVREWFQREGIKVESIKNPRAEFLFKVKFMRFFFTVVRPNDQKFIQVETQVMISPDHLKKLTAEKMKKFQISAMRFAFTQDISVGFIQPRPNQPGPKPPGPGFVVSDRIYDDAYSDDMLWRTLRKVHRVVDMIIHILNDITGEIGPKTTEPTEAGPSYYT